MCPNRFCRKSYLMLLNLHNQGYVTWVDRVKRVLYTYGFGFVWEAQGVGNEISFLKCFRERLVDCYRQTWNTSLESHDFYRPYVLYKRALCIEPYVIDVSNFWHRKALARFRFGMTELNDSFLTFDRTRNVKNKNCPFCTDHLENETHFLFVCPVYATLRVELLPKDIMAQEYIQIIANQTSTQNKRLAEYVYKALNLRNKMIDDTT